jgi:hypothetical protein
MHSLTKRIAALCVLCFAVSLVGCEGQPIFPHLNTTSPVPFDGIVVGPNEKIRLNARTVKRNEYFCSNGAPLQCERFGFKLDCSCPAH